MVGVRSEHSRLEADKETTTTTGRWVEAVEKEKREEVVSLSTVVSTFTVSTDDRRRQDGDRNRGQKREIRWENAIVRSYEIRGQSSCPINADRRVPVSPPGKASFFSQRRQNLTSPLCRTGCIGRASIPIPRDS
ncbi:hypothetical protein K0M31_020313 [Melipona bicolor]|uniref:Uncharacterized protein n=1 Tax=Melipona bicolor TaxID=60889 RepID=A0AA40G2A5_9HYME|nr:hypothetical protein K0M31_020313 [Melipona bicolor]